MIHILARNNHAAKAFAGEEEYILVQKASELFGAKKIHVMFDWESGKSACTLRAFTPMLLAQTVSPLCVVVRHDKLMV